MPSKSESQARFMAACSHGADYPSCPPSKVSTEFNQADKGSALLHNAMKRRFASGGINVNSNQNPYLQMLAARAAGQGMRPGSPPQPQMTPQNGVPQQRPPMAPPQGGALSAAGSPGIRPQMPMRPGGMPTPGQQPMQPGMPMNSQVPMRPPGMMPNPGMVNGQRPGMPGQMPNQMPQVQMPNPPNRPWMGGIPNGSMGMARGGRTHFDLGGPNLASMSPLSSGMSAMHNSGISSSPVAHAHMRMPRIPIADTLRNIDQGLHQTAHIMKPKISHLAGGGMPEPMGESAQQQPQLGPQAIAALGMAMAHMQGGDHGSAAGALMSSPEAMKHPHVAAVAHHLKASKDIGPAHKVLGNLINSLGGGGGGPGATAMPPAAGGGGGPGGMKKGGATRKEKGSSRSHQHQQETRRSR